jgi:2-iminobutanoate/2-iminopropanoate deaminase
MSDPTAVRTESAPAPVDGAPYSQGVIAGELVFVSGQVPHDPATGKLAGDGIVDQTKQIFANLSAILEAAGSSVGRIVKTTVYMTDLQEFAAMNDAYRELVGSPPPARATIEVSKLPAGARLEIECVALRG